MQQDEEQRKAKWGRLTRYLPTRALVGGLVIILILVWIAVFNLPDGKLHVTFLDVGQGDSAWLNTPDGWDILIDGGESWQGQELVSYLEGHGVVDIEVMILTHPHADHVGGLVAVVQNLEVDQVLSNCQPHTSGIYQTFQDLITDEGIPVECVRDGDIFVWGSYVSATAVHPPDPLMSGTGSDLNNNSIVLRITHGSIDVLFTGDIEAAGEVEILSGGATLEAEVLKVAESLD